MIQKTIWSPDTCDCQIEYQWDDAVSEEKRTHTASRIIRACAIHQVHTDKDEHFDDVLQENQSKNQAIAVLFKTIGKIDGGEKDVRWRFDADRNVIISHPLLTADDKNVLNSLDKSAIAKEVIFE